MTSFLLPRLYKIITLFVLICISVHLRAQDTKVINVRTTVDPQNLDLVVTYDLLSVGRSDSLYVVFYIDQRRVAPRPGTVRGDIGFGIRKGYNHQLRWNFSQENLTGSRSIVAEIIGVSFQKPGLFSGKKGHLAIYGLIGGAAAGIYAATLASKITSDAQAYNQSPDPTSSQAEQALQTQKNAIESKKTLFYASVGIAAALFIADGFLLAKNKRSVKQPSVSLTAPFGNPSATVAWTIR